jgi:hypothetical protein
VVKARPAEILAGVAGALLFLSLWFDWFSEAGALGQDIMGERTFGTNAWQQLAILDILLAVVAVGGILVLVTHALSRSPAVPMAVNVAVAALATIAVLFVVYRLIDQPGPNERINVEVGAYLGLLFTLGVAVGSWWAMRDESPRAADRPVPVEERPAPPATSAAPGPRVRDAETEPADGAGAEPREPS